MRLYLREDAKATLNKVHFPRPHRTSITHAKCHVTPRPAMLANGCCAQLPFSNLNPFLPPPPRSCRAAGHGMFCDRRWLSPANPADRARLESGYVALCEEFPEFAACPRYAFLARLAEVCGARNRMHAQA